MKVLSGLLFGSLERHIHRSKLANRGQIDADLGVASRYLFSFSLSGVHHINHDLLVSDQGLVWVVEQVGVKADSLAEDALISRRQMLHTVALGLAER